jgi:hypothetical protein
MAHLIDKDALVAEIEKIMYDLSPNFYEYDYDAAKVELLEKLLTFINTLEVKEVDLEEELYEYCSSEEYREAIGTGKLAFLIAKHFFELGMSVSNKAHKGEKV